MKISSEINSIAKLTGQEKAIEYMARAGFDAWDYSLFHLTCEDYTDNKKREELIAHSKRLGALGLYLGITCNQAHAPFPTKIESAKIALECAAAAGAPICVVHPLNRNSAEQNAELFSALLPLAKDLGIKIATENMWNWDYEGDIALPAACSSPEDFVKHVDLICDDSFVACLDVGHAEMAGIGTSAPEMIRALGHRLCALHLHDNDKHLDSHQIPFSMQIDFEAIIEALADIGYSGDVTLEADRYMSAYTEETAYDGVKKLADAAKKLRSMLEDAENT